ncbi:hypothetical protein ACFL9T_10730 [Thermodesulfobacteriota bacterium]
MSQKISKKDIKKFKPSGFMRARRPELFSDSKIVTESILTKGSLEYHLNTLTKRKQEYDFEHFCRLIAEKELCANLLPQTGPTGGGDSKVDSETYPVADSISLRWYVGIGREAEKERWAFAFSAKEKWRSKVKADVKKIIDTDRNYKLIYFITNQFVKDKARSDVEDELKRFYGVEIRILDRNWLVEKVFTNNRVKIAIETLKLSGVDEKKQKNLGPHDSERKNELKEIESQIEDDSRYIGVKYQLVEDCLRAALLSRGLGFPRVEVEGRFLRAERFANRFGISQQQLRVKYNRAWTVFWWYDDFEEFNSLYDSVEKLSLNSNQASDLELLTNLWQLLKSSITHGQLNKKKAKIKERTKKLKSHLDQLSLEEKRPNNSLHAKTNRLLIDLSESMHDKNKLKSVLEDFKKIIEDSEYLSEYPMIPLKNLLKDLGELLSDNKTYDDLLETLISSMSKRKSEGESGRILMQRGYQKLKVDKIYDAIRYFGRAQQKLAKREYYSDFIAASAGCGLAYEHAGLLWAARANMISAVNYAMSEFWKHGEIIPQVFPCVRKMVWLELQLGRVPYVLSWIQLETIVSNRLQLDPSIKEKFRKEFRTQDIVLGLLLLKTEIRGLRWLAILPPVLDSMELFSSWMATLYALGYEDFLREEGVIPKEQKHEDVIDLFQMWINQPAKGDIPNAPLLIEESKINFYSYVLGCEIIAEVDNNFYSICIAEIILGALEALLSTSLNLMLIPYRSDFYIKIKPSDFIGKIPEYKIVDTDEGSFIEIRHQLSAIEGSISFQNEFCNWLLEAIITIASQIAIIEDVELYFKQVAEHEKGFERALNFSGISIALTNLFGDIPKYRISDWVLESDNSRFSLKRNKSWYEDIPTEPTTGKYDSIYSKFGSGEPPSELFGIDSLKHPQRRVFSLINTPLWNKAKWKATVYLHFPDANIPPLIAFGFKNERAGRAIFKEWQNRLGQVDKDELLRIAIIKGIDRKNPHAYSVIVGINPKFSEDDAPNQMVLISRINRMDPPDSKNLDILLSNYSIANKYIVLPALFTDERTPPKPFFELGIIKNDLHIREAWELQINDPDLSAISVDDEPVIPDGVENPPITKSLEWLRAMRKSF